MKRIAASNYQTLPDGDCIATPSATAKTNCKTMQTTCVKRLSESAAKHASYSIATMIRSRTDVSIDILWLYFFRLNEATRLRRSLCLHRVRVAVVAEQRGLVVDDGLDVDGAAPQFPQMRERVFRVVELQRHALILVL